MTAQEFLDWMEAADCRFAADIIRTLDVGRTQAERWLADAKAGKPVEVKRTVALAMAATVAGLAPWPERKEP